jgi:tRNA nucleotidyltransferase (CCA-adding enzyme)
MNPPGTLDLSRPLHEWERSLLERCDLYLVGGTVRDLLLGSSADSFDEDYLASRIPLDDLVSLLEHFGTVNLVGRSFGVLKFTPDAGRTVDVSMPRSEFSTGPGHREFSVTFDPGLPVETDLERRDFTINSMALDLRSGALVDPLGGRDDLARRLLRMNRPDSFVEDPLRILRGVQLFARFALEAEPGTRSLMRRDAVLLVSVSPERVRDEINKMLLRSAEPSRGFILMHEERILGVVLPELERAWGVEQNEYHPDDVFTHSLKSCDLAPPRLALRWGALLHDLGKPDMKQVVDGRTVFYRHEERSAHIAEGILERLRFSNEDRSRIVALVSNHMLHMTQQWSDAAVRRFIARVGVENIGELLALREADGRSRGDAGVVAENKLIRERIERIRLSESAFKISDLAIGGRDVMEALGIPEGPEVGTILRALLEAVLEEPSTNTREALTALAKGLARKR